MKSSEPVSAFAVYKTSIKSSPKKHKRNAITKSKMKRKRNVNGIDQSKVQLSIKDDKRLNKKAKMGKVQTNKLKDKESTQIEDKPEKLLNNKKNLKKKLKLKKEKSSGEYKRSVCQIVSSKKSREKSKLSSCLALKNKTSMEIPTPNIYYDPSPSSQDPIMKGYQLFEWMISPITPNCFFQNYWETKSLHVARKNKNYYTHLLTSRHLDHIFRENSLYYTRNVDVVVYENEEKQVMNPEGRAHPSALWDFYSNGCSIRVLNPQSYNKKVHLLVSTLQEYFGSMVGVNVYLTPPGSQGFAPHFDDIEAFVIQLEGRKHWKLYEPQGEDVLARFSSKNFTHDEIGQPILEVALEAGDLLYFPRGVIHEGTTDSESHSLHLTVSLYQNNAYVDLLEKALPNALLKAAKSDIEFRKGLPLHFIRSGDAKQLIVEKVSALMDKLKDYLDVDTGINELGRKLVYDSMPPVLSVEEMACSSKQDGDLLDNGIVYNKVEFDLATKVRLTRYHCIQLVYDEFMKPKLYYSTENSNVYHGEEEQWLDLDPCMIPAVEALQKAYPFYIGVGFLPIEGVELKVQFVYDLWEKGIVITKEPLGNNSTNENGTTDIATDKNVAQ